jgi:hypothetical protein
VSAPRDVPTRLVDAQAQVADATATRAAELLGRLAAPPARLPPSARARIAARLEESAAGPPAGRVRWPALAVAALVLVVGLTVGGAVGAAGGLAPARRWLGQLLSMKARPATPRPEPRAAPPVALATAAPVAPAPAAPAEAAPATEPRPAHPARRATRPTAAIAPPAEEPVVAESRLLASALRELRQQRDPAAALAALDDYERRFPAGALAPEAAAARVDALLALGRRAQALARLEALPLDRLPRGSELRALRGELRAGRGELGAALDDFSAVLAGPSPPPAVVERALYGRGSCRARLGDVTGARSDLGEVVRRFPNGPFAEPARRALRD